MSTDTRTVPPFRAGRRRRRPKALLLDTSRRGGVRLRRSGFWSGLGGLVITIGIAMIVVALLVGWVLVWASRAAGPNVVWLTLGSVAFTAVLALLGMLILSLRASHRLRQAEAAFLTGASHNLRTPLAAISAAAQTIQLAALSNDDRASLLQAIVHETSRLELRVDNLLETARLDLEREPFTIERIDLGALVAAVLEDARWAFTASGGGFSVGAMEPLYVDGDPSALRLLFDNLIDNTLKYADGPARVVATVHPTAGHVVARIRDQGIGFVPGDANALFHRFYRGDTGRPGSGLGLALARAIARGHRGELVLESDGPGRGATAEVWLPLSSAAEDR